MDALKPKPQTESEEVLVSLTPSPYDLRKAILFLEKRVATLEADAAARNTPAPPQPDHLPADSYAEEEASDGDGFGNPV